MSHGQGNSRRRHLRIVLPAAITLLGSMLGAVPTAVAAAGHAATGTSGSVAARTTTWQEDLTKLQSGDVNVTTAAGRISVLNPRFHTAASHNTTAYGTAMFSEHRLAAPSELVTVSLKATQPAGSKVVTEVRGLGSDGRWSEWTDADRTGAVRLPRPAGTVQARITLLDNAQGASPMVTGLALTASGNTASVTSPTVAATPLSYKVFATDEADVGGQTANMHIIQPNDHFVALPSGKALSPEGTNDYSVQVCGPAKCETAPVWDVGPWNIHDDYWDSPRSEFPNLAQGLPEAQAAYQNGYNGGYDDYYGNKILNPAGIDLADGTFSDIGLTDNGWVTVTYLWTGSTGTAPAAPSVGITSPVVSGLVGGNVTVTASASDSTSGAALSTQFYVDGSAIGSAVAGSAPSVTWNSTALNGAHTLTAVTTATTGGGHASTTSAGVLVNVRNRFQAAFNASGGSNTLYLYGNGTGAINGSTPVGVAPGTHPAITELAGGGFQIAFTADKTNQLYLYGTGPGSVTGTTPVGVAAGTSPAITALPGGGFQTVFTASSGNTLWRYGVGAGSYTGSTPVGVAPGTSPAITTLSNGSIQVAFTAANSNALYLYGDGPGTTNSTTPVGIAAGTSPAITALPGGGFQTVFTASSGNTLWRYGVGAGSYTGSTPVGVAPGTSPAIN